MVTAILPRAKMRTGNAFAVSSDGKWFDWEKDRNLAQEIWHEKMWNVRSISSKRWRAIGKGTRWFHMEWDPSLTRTTQAH